MKKLILISLLSIAFNVNAQQGSFRILNDARIQIGYGKYKYLSFGISSPMTNNVNNGAFAIEHWSNGLNFWRPWPSGMYGNYRLFLSDDAKCGINMKPGNINSTSYDINAEALHIKGKAKSTGWLTWSDSSLKSNISPITNTLQKVIQLAPVSYNYKSIKMKLDTTINLEDSIKNLTVLGELNIVNSESNDLRFGFVAQDVEKLFPNLVSKDAGLSSINYSDIIPLLVSSIKEQQLIIENLKQEVQNWKGRSIDSLTSKSKLFQNSPNPFETETIFTYFIDEPNTFINATIEVRDIMGSLKNVLTLGDKSGLGKITFNATGYINGYYIYTLKIDGQLKDSKMFLIEQ
jgi:hypothetical protein